MKNLILIDRETLKVKMILKGTEEQISEYFITNGCVHIICLEVVESVDIENSVEVLELA